MVQILTGSCTILIYAVHVTHSFAVLGTCEALVGCTPESSPGKTKNKRDGEDNNGNNFGFGNLVTYLVRKHEDIFSLWRERQKGVKERGNCKKGHGNSIPVTQ